MPMPASNLFNLEDMRLIYANRTANARYAPYPSAASRIFDFRYVLEAPKASSIVLSLETRGMQKPFVDRRIF